MGALLVLGACLCWAIDNNLTRKVSTNDSMLVAGLKGLVAGACNTALALGMGAQLPGAMAVAGSLAVGFLGYGLSLTLFVVGLRILGTARTGAYFSVAPLFGVVISLGLWPESPSTLSWVAAGLMTLGVWLHVSERHVHEHTHEPLEHNHRHRHDEHHQHEHDFGWQGEEPHVHPHRHDVLTHKHPHYRTSITGMDITVMLQMARLRDDAAADLGTHLGQKCGGVLIFHLIDLPAR